MAERDFFKDRFSETEIRSLLGGRSPSDIFSWRSPSFKAMGLDPLTLSEEELVRLMLEEPRLIRRPIVRIGSGLVVGANIVDLEKALEAT